MIENNFERKLKLPVEFIPVFDDNPAPHMPYSLDLINNEFKNWLDSKDMAVAHSERFFLEPTKAASLPIHIDVFLPEQSDHIVKINFVYCHKMTHMNWYELTDNIELTTIPTSVNSYYKLVDKKNAKLIHSVQTDRPRLVNAAIPHDVYPPVTAPRFSFCFILKRKSSQQKISWKEALEIFEDCIE